MLIDNERIPKCVDTRHTCTAAARPNNRRCIAYYVVILTQPLTLTLCMCSHRGHICCTRATRQEKLATQPAGNKPRREADIRKPGSLEMHANWTETKDSGWLEALGRATQCQEAGGLQYQSATQCQEPGGLQYQLGCAGFTNNLYLAY